MARAKTIQLPRGYLSWTQLQLWERNRKQYERIYFYGEEPPKSMYMSFGSEVASDAENGSSERETVKALNALLPTYDIVEHTINTAIKTSGGLIIPLHGRLDTCKSTLEAFRERKTGKVPWTQAKVDRHGQIDYYSMLIYLESGKAPQAWLDWAQTYVNAEGEVELTGEHTEFIATRTTVDILRMIHRATNAAMEIAETYETKLMAL